MQAQSWDDIRRELNRDREALDKKLKLIVTDPLMVEFTIPGEPKGKARHRSTPLMRNGRPVLGNGGRPVVIQHSDKKTVLYENLVTRYAEEAMRGRTPFDCPMRLDIHAFVPIPKSWSQKKQAMAANGDVMPTTKPDCDNLQKAVLDGMNKVVFRDDVVVCEVFMTKRYSIRPRVEVRAVVFAAKGAR